MSGYNPATRNMSGTQAHVVNNLINKSRENKEKYEKEKLERIKCENKEVENVSSSDEKKEVVTETNIKEIKE